MFCPNCGTATEPRSQNFCSNCGHGLTSSQPSTSGVASCSRTPDHVEDHSDSTEEEVIDEEEVIKYYFNRGYSYQEIIQFLFERHGLEISYSTLLRRLNSYGLCRRGATTKEDFNATFMTVQQRITELLTGPCSSTGYRGIWHILELEGIRVPRIIVEDLLREIDPEGAELRKKHRLKRRKYLNPGPDFAWHIDGYDKLKHWGFPIHGGIDGFSRKILWLEVARSNNCPNNIAWFYIRAVVDLGGCPVELITDLGTENGLAASIQSFFRDNPDSHRYVASPRNQRIEGWWSFFSKSQTVWWRNFFQDLESQGIVDTSSELRMECLWFCFNKLIQQELDRIKEQWNTHRIRKSRHGTVPGRPDSLYFLPNLHGTTSNLRMEVPHFKLEYVLQHVLDTEMSGGEDGFESEANEYQNYFDYVLATLSIRSPENWQEALALYRRLVQVAENG